MPFLPILLVAPVASPVIALETLKSALQALNTHLSYAVISGDHKASENSVFLVLEFSTFDHAEDALDVLNTSFQADRKSTESSLRSKKDDNTRSLPFVAGIPLVLKSLPESYTDAMLQDLISPFGTVISARVFDNLGGVVFFRTKNEATGTQKNAGQAQIILEELDYSNCWQIISETTLDDDEQFQIIDDLDTRDILRPENTSPTWSELTDLMLSLARRFISRVPQAISSIISPVNFPPTTNQGEPTNGPQLTIESRCSDLEATIRALQDEISAIRRATETKFTIEKRQTGDSGSQTDQQRLEKLCMQLQLSKQPVRNAPQARRSVMEQVLDLLIDLDANGRQLKLESLTATDSHASIRKQAGDSEDFLRKISSLERDIATLQEERTREREEHLAEISALKELRAELQGWLGAPPSREKSQNHKSTTEGIQRMEREERRSPRDSRKSKATLSEIQRIDVDATLVASTRAPLTLLRPRKMGPWPTLESADDERSTQVK